MYIPNITKPVSREAFIDLKAIFKDNLIYVINNEIKVKFDILKAYKSKNKEVTKILKQIVDESDYSVVDAVTFVTQR